MEYIIRKDIENVCLPGRMMQKVVGKPEDGYPVPSQIMHVGYCHYCAEAGPMSPHMHSEETVQILNSDRAWVRYGGEPEALQHRLELEKNMTLHFAPGEWHVFEYEEGGSLDILFIYGEKVAL